MGFRTFDNFIASRFSLVFEGHMYPIRLLMIPSFRNGAESADSNPYIKVNWTEHSITHYRVQYFTGDFSQSLSLSNSNHVYVCAIEPSLSSRAKLRTPLGDHLEGNIVNSARTGWSRVQQSSNSDVNAHPNESDYCRNYAKYNIRLSKCSTTKWSVWRWRGKRPEWAYPYCMAKVA